MRIRNTAAFTGAAALALLAGAAGSTQASPTATIQGCKSGQVCVYDHRGAIVVAQYDGWSGNSQAGVIFNNGRSDPGADHIRWRGHTAIGDAHGCLHFQASNSTDSLGWPAGTAGVMMAGDPNSTLEVRVTSLRWGGECASTEKVFEYGSTE
ncbi:hypothetical protein [Streptomyces sp. BE147]|uniref:hypothetical protein n=1 Tax=unclassified Streptomyces TaxID=2593676 RepID=UPI002E775AA6|nr:hypothetical protein [Streptomyces sp. BE147]MEE1738714.1 hypothetical protein [Streptomyces sp. BE147]